MLNGTKIWVFRKEYELPGWDLIEEVDTAIGDE